MAAILDFSQSQVQYDLETMIGEFLRDENVGLGTNIGSLGGILRKILTI